MQFSLKKMVDEEDNVVSMDALVEFLEPPSVPHVPKRVCIHTICIVKWENQEEEASTWEHVANNAKSYADFILSGKRVQLGSLGIYT